MTPRLRRIGLGAATGVALLALAAAMRACGPSAGASRAGAEPIVGRPQGLTPDDGSREHAQLTGEGGEPTAVGRRAALESAPHEPESPAPDELWLSGRVVDELGAPLAGAKVLVSLDDTHRRARSDEHGAFRVLGPPLLARTSLALSIVASDGDWDEGRHVTRTVQAGELRAPVLVPTRTRVRWSVSGDPEAHGLGTGFRVQRDPPGDMRPADVILDEGVGVVYGLPPGRYDLVFTVWLGATLTTAPLASFELDAHERLELGTLQLESALSLRRIVLTHDGEPLAAEVVVRVEAAEPSAESSQFNVSREVGVDAGGGVVLPVPKGVVQVPDLTFTVERMDTPPLVGRLAGLRGGETLALEPEPAPGEATGGG